MQCSTSWQFCSPLSYDGVYYLYWKTKIRSNWHLPTKECGKFFKGLYREMESWGQPCYWLSYMSEEEDIGLTCLTIWTKFISLLAVLSSLIIVYNIRAFNFFFALLIKVILTKAVWFVLLLKWNRIFLTSAWTPYSQGKIPCFICPCTYIYCAMYWVVSMFIFSFYS